MNEMKRTRHPRPRQEMQTKMAMKIATSFNRTTGLDLDDLFQQACLIYAEAEQDGRFDPGRGVKFTTYVYRRIQTGLIDYCHRQRRLNAPLVFTGNVSAGDEDGVGEQAMDDFEAPAAGPDCHAALREFVERLDPDSRAVCELVLKQSADYGPLHWHNARSRVKADLRGLGWSRSRIQWVLGEVRRAVTSELGGRLDARV